MDFGAEKKIDKSPDWISVYADSEMIKPVIVLVDDYDEILAIILIFRKTADAKIDFDLTEIRLDLLHELFFEHLIACKHQELELLSFPEVYSNQNGNNPRLARAGWMLTQSELLTFGPYNARNHMHLQRLCSVITFVLLH